MKKLFLISLLFINIFSLKAESEVSFDGSRYKRCKDAGLIALYTSDPYLKNLTPKISLKYSDENAGG